MKNAIVCGGSRGLGRSIALALARDGWGVAVCARSREGVERVARELERVTSRVYAQACDLRDEAAVERFVSNATNALGAIDAGAALRLAGRFMPRAPVAPSAAEGRAVQENSRARVIEILRRPTESLGERHGQN